MGLHSGHAYSLLDTGSISDKKAPKGPKIRLIKLRNPWGYGEWEGAFSDRSDEREEYDEELMKAFSCKEHEVVDINAQDGTFFMRYYLCFLAVILRVLCVRIFLSGIYSLLFLHVCLYGWMHVRAAQMCIMLIAHHSPSICFQLHN